MFKKKKVPRKRSQKRISEKKLKCKIFGINSAGIKSKLKSFKKVLDNLKPTI